MTYEEKSAIVIEQLRADRDRLLDAFNKMIDEIEQIEINGHIRDAECFRAGINVALNIINKYKAEGEEREWNL